MNINIVLAISVALVFGGSRGNATDEPSSEPLVSVTLSGEPLGEVLHQLHAQSGYAIVLDSELARTRGPQMYVAPIPALRALRVIAAAYGACAHVVSDTVVAFRACRDASLTDTSIEPPKVRLGVVIDRNGAEYPPYGRGVAVTEIRDDQAAAFKAGIRTGDVILSYNGQSISDGTQLQSLVGQTRPGDSVPLVVLRGPQILAFDVQF